MNQPVKVQVDNNTPNIKCVCGCVHFQERYILKHVSKLLTGAEADVIMPIKFYACIVCGEPVQYGLLTIPVANPTPNLAG